MASVLSVLKKTSRIIQGNALLKIETAGASPIIFVCQFNPEELNIGTTGKFVAAERQGQDAPIIQYMGGSCSQIDLKLYFSTATSYEIKPGVLTKPAKEKAEDVSVYTKQLMSLACIDGKLHRPPEVTFVWGSLDFSGYVQSVDTKYLMFEKGGKPVRAEVVLHFISPNLSPVQMERLSPRESPDRTKCVVMTSDSSLWDIAEREYGDASYWREIAKANHIMNPLEIPVGTHLKVPALY